jgi:uncharacterized lipoprotein YmbA
MKRFLIAALAVLALTACSKETKETTYPMTATIVSRDPAKNTVNLDNVEVPGKMAAMKMDYELRGAKVGELPPDGSAVVVTVHDVNGSYYVTDVKTKK